MRLRSMMLVAFLVLLGSSLPIVTQQAVRAAPSPLAVPQAVCPATIPLGEVFSCSLGGAAEKDEYTFEAATNDKFLIRVVQTSGDFYTTVEVFNPSATRIEYFDGNALAIQSFSVTTSGTFRLRIRDYYNTGTGDYQVYMQRINGAANAQPAAFSSLINGSLDQPIETDVYTFTASINDKIEFRLHRTEGAFYTRLAVYDASGNRDCYDEGQEYSLIVPCTIEADGTYAVFIDDYYSASTGTYQWGMYRWGQADGALPVGFGSITAGSLDSVIESDVYTLTAEINDQLVLRAQRESGDFYVRMRVYDQDGNDICYDDGQTLAIKEPCVIPASGIYTIFIDDYYLKATGTYRLHLQRLNKPGSPLSIKPGQQLSDAIAPLAALDAYSFEARANDKVKVVFTRTSGAFYPRIRIYNSGGVRICYDDGAPIATIAACAISADGSYFIMVDDYYVENVGEYTLALSCIEGSCSSRIFIPLVRR
jgi:hypothetical protein